MKYEIDFDSFFDDDNSEDNLEKSIPDVSPLLQYRKEYEEMLEKHNRQEPINMERAEFLQEYLIRNGVLLYDRINWNW